MLEGIRPGTEKRCEMLRLYLEKGISQSTFRELILPMEGKKRGGKGENRRGDYTEADEQYQLRNERLRVGWVWEEKMQELHERELHEKSFDQA